MTPLDRANAEIAAVLLQDAAKKLEGLGWTDLAIKAASLKLETQRRLVVAIDGPKAERTFGGGVALKPASVRNSSVDGD